MKKGHNTFRKLIFKEISEFLLIFLFLFLGLSFLVNTFERLSTVIKKHISVFLYAKYLFWKELLNFFEFFPFLLPFSIMIGLFFMERRREILAFFSLGFTKEEILRELNFYGLCLSLLVWIFYLLCFPLSIYNMITTWENEILKNKKNFTLYNGKVFLKGKNFIFVGKPVDESFRYFRDVFLVVLKKASYKGNQSKEEVFKVPEKLVLAKKMIIQEEKWIFYEGISESLNKNFFPERFKVLEYPIGLSPFSIRAVEKSLKMLSIPELLERYRFLKETGFSTKEVLIEAALRGIYFFIPFLIFLPVSYLIFGEYNPSNLEIRYLRGLAGYFFMSFLVLLLQNFINRGWLVFVIIFFGLIICELFSLFWLVFLKKSGKK